MQKLMSLPVLSPNDVAETLTGRRYLSHSAISTFQSCSLKYFFRYVAKLPEEKTSASLIFGSAFHQAIQFHFEGRLAGDEELTIKELLDVFTVAWKGFYAGAAGFDEEDLASAILLAERMLVAFLESDVARPKGEVIGVEEEIRASIDPTVPYFLARLDLVLMDESGIHVRDFKTAKCKWSEADAQVYAAQLLLYYELAKERWPDQKVTADFLVITKTKTPSVTVHSIDITESKLDRLKRTIRSVWNAIEAGHFYPAPQAINCFSCPYENACSLWVG